MLRKFSSFFAELTEIFTAFWKSFIFEKNAALFLKTLDFYFVVVYKSYKEDKGASKYSQ